MPAARRLRRPPSRSWPRRPCGAWPRPAWRRALGEARAARLQRRLTLDVLQAAGAASLGPVELWCAPDARHRFFRALRRHCGIVTQAQVAGDLGARMQAVMDAHFAASGPGQPLLIVGTDCPLLAPGHLQQAARALATHDSVLIPAEDGGYVLLGLARPLPQVFRAIAWSTAQVAAQTRERLRGAGATWTELPPLADLDEPADWARTRDFYAGIVPIGHTGPAEPAIETATP
jgi:rSAM/selenodomain-associated transferase 1